MFAVHQQIMNDDSRHEYDIHEIGDNERRRRNSRSDGPALPPRRGGRAGSTCERQLVVHAAIPVGVIGRDRHLVEAVSTEQHRRE